MRDIVPVAGIMQAPSVLEVTPSFPVNTIAEFIAYAKAHPGKVNIGTAGNGSPPHMFAELFKMMTGVELDHGGLSRRRAGAGRSALRPDPGHDRGHHLIDRLPAAGKLRPLAVTSAKRSAALPDVPPIADAVPGYDATGWFGLGAPRRHAATGHRPA